MTSKITLEIEFEIGTLEEIGLGGFKAGWVDGEKDGRTYYRHGDHELPVRARTLTVPFKTDSGLARRSFTVYYTAHGPVVRHRSSVLQIAET